MEPCTWEALFRRVRPLIEAEVRAGTSDPELVLLADRFVAREASGGDLFGGSAHLPRLQGYMKDYRDSLEKRRIQVRLAQIRHSIKLWSHGT